MSQQQLNVIVLAAGLSRRMGTENKLLLPFQGKTILETTISNIIEAKIGQITVVVGYESEKIKAILKNFTLSTESESTISIIENSDYEKGMTTSIQAGIKTTQNFGYMICLSDMLWIQPDEYQLLAKAFFDILKTDEKAIIQPIFEKKRGNPVIFSHFYKNAILETTDTEGCRSVVQAHKNHLHFVEMRTNHVLQDIDFQEDYKKLLAE